MYSYWQIYRAVWQSYSPKQKGLAMTLGLIFMDRVGVIVWDFIGYIIDVIWRADSLLFSVVACAVGYTTYRCAQANEASDPDPTSSSGNES